jgi:uncharacterized phage protein (TIGR02218 family)
MSYAAIAQLLSGQRPFYLYRFARGSSEWLFTSRPGDIERAVGGVSGTTWTASAVSHGRIPDSDQAFRSELTITFPLSDEFAFGLIEGFEFEPVSVRIWRGFLNDQDNELVTQFVGQVLSASPEDDGRIRLICMTDLAAMQRKGLAAVIQRPCRHPLYGRGCGLTLADWQESGDVLSISSDGRVVEVDGLGYFGEGYFLGGVLSWNGRHSMILRQDVDEVTIRDAIPGLVAAVGEGTETVDVAPGCPLTRTACEERFDNLLNFGGFPWMSDNPFDGRQVF